MALSKPLDRAGSKLLGSSHDNVLSFSEVNMNTRKDYERAASLIARIDDGLARGIVTTVFIRFFANDNPRFDQDRFVEKIRTLRLT